MPIGKDIIFSKVHIMQKWQKKVLPIICLSGMLNLELAFASIPVNYTNLMGEERWQASGNHLRCGLAYPLPNYGVAYFEQYATQPAQFIIRQWHENHKISRTLVSVTPPVWKPYGKSYVITKTYVTPSRYGLYLNENATLKLLTFLSQGYQGIINYKSEQNFNVTLVLSPIKFRKMYARYQRCVGQLLSLNYKDVAETTFYFPTDGRELDDEMKKKLRSIVQYVRADDQIEKVKIYGYTDGSGRNGYNNAISEDRAKRVSNFLMKNGLTKNRLSVTWFGESKPFARNDTDEGRAKNRRVEIRLIKK